MKKFLISLTIVLYCFVSLANSGKFPEKQTAIIYSKSIELLSEYQSLINEMGEQAVKDVEMAKSKKEKLLELFINRKVLVYNDLDPSHTLSEFYEAETYASNIILWYPDGMVVDLDLENAKVSSIKQHDKNVFSIDILLKKQIEGNYMNKTFNNAEEELTFRVGFSHEGNSFENFNIAGIRSPESEGAPKDSKTLKEVNSEQLSKAELQKIHTGLGAVLHDYKNYLALIGDPEEYEEDKKFYRESFLKLFKNNEVTVYNDIMPKPDQTFYSPEKYVDAYAENYPEGIKNLAINMDSAEYGAAIKDDKGRYYSYVYADKFFSGQFKGEDAYRTQTKMMAKISYEKKGNTYTDFKIESIDKEGYEYYQNNEEAEVPEIAIKPVTREGLAISAFAVTGQGYINDETINNITIENNLYDYTVQHDFAYHAGAGLSYFLNDNIGLKTGVQYSRFSSKYSLDGQFQNDELTKDANDAQHYDIVTATMDSTVNVSAISLPIAINYHYGRPAKVGFFAEGGVNLGYNVRNEYELTGDIETSGYYPQYDEVIQYLNYEELGYYSRENLSESGEADIKSFNFGVHAALGISLPLGYYNSLLIGPEVQYGLSNLNNRNTYTDIFGNEVKTGKMNMYSFSLKISYIYKL